LLENERRESEKEGKVEEWCLMESSVIGRSESNLSLRMRGGSGAIMGGRSATKTSERSRRSRRGRDKVERLREVGIRKFRSSFGGQEVNFDMT
jgi:hypothetical protein